MIDSANELRSASTCLHLRPFNHKRRKCLQIWFGWGGHQEQPVDQNAPEADRRNVPDDVISVSDSEVDQDSSQGDESSYASGSSASDGGDCSDSEPGTTSEGELVGGNGSLNQLESLPAHWPPAKLVKNRF